ncbi:MAG TPA: lycopene cyclase family protein, partial [Myxococcota bacterium]
PNTLCAFADQLPAPFVGRRYPRSVVVTSAGTVDLQRATARLDADALAAEAGSFSDVVVDRVIGLGDAGRLLRLGGGSRDVGVVVDASGHRPVLIARTATSSPIQSAFGLVVRGVDAELPAGTALFMDWRDHGVDDGGPPSFLYALSDDDGTLLLEETTLASSPAVPANVLERRLLERLRRRGTRIDDIIATEHVAFPMAAGLPAERQDVVAFGVAAGLVQPISGYSIARSAAAAPGVADVVVAGLAAGHAPEQIAADVDAALWPAAARQQRALLRHGLDMLCGFDAADADAFFTAFFALPTSSWRPFLDGSGDLATTQTTMWNLFQQSPRRIRRRLAVGAGVLRTFGTVATYAHARLARAGGRR